MIYGLVLLLLIGLRYQKPRRGLVSTNICIYELARNTIYCVTGAKHPFATLIFIEIITDIIKNIYATNVF